VMHDALTAGEKIVVLDEMSFSSIGENGKWDCTLPSRKYDWKKP